MNLSQPGLRFPVADVLYFDLASRSLIKLSKLVGSQLRRSTAVTPHYIAQVGVIDKMGTSK